MAITSIYAGAREADVAMVTTGGVTFWCFSWLAGTAGNGGARVEAKIFAEGEDGQMALVHSAIVATPSGDYVDCPRVLPISSASDARFAIHWINVDGNGGTYRLYRSLFDLAAISSGWISQGWVALHSTLQYDLATVDGSSEGQFVVSRRTAIGTIVTTRYQSPWSWLDVAWSTTTAGLTIDDTVLAAHANHGDAVAFAFYQSIGTLRMLRYNVSTGAQTHDTEIIGTFDGATEHQYTAVTLQQVSENRYVVLGENRPDSTVFTHQRRIVGRLFSGANASTIGEIQWAWNLHLLSRAWRWASGTLTSYEIFTACSFKSMADGQEFDQQYGYVVRWDVADWRNAAQATVRPIPVAALMDGSVDARPHGTSPAYLLTIGVRLNHLSHAPGPPAYTLGPNLKSKLFALTRWGRYVVVNDGSGSELHPAEAGVGWLRHHHEPPWTARRTDVEPTQPDTPAWRGASEAIALPVPTPAGLVFTGGVATAYDGECAAELGFLWVPEIVNVDVANAGGNVGDAGTYYWYVNYVWVDNRGGIIRGGPSRPVSAVLEADGFATLTVRCCNLGMAGDLERYPLNAPVGIEVWRTYVVDGALVTDGDASLGTAVYLFRSEYGENSVGWRLQDLPQNDPGAFSVEIVVGRPNITVATNELGPYQLNLSSLQWTPPPPIPHQPLGPACLWQDRLFGQDPANNAIVWSEQITRIGSRYEWPRFLDTNRFETDGVSKITAMEPMDSALIVYTRDAIYALTGDPGAGGSGGALSLQQIARGIGCDEPRSVVTYTEGQVFQSAKGLHALSRGQGVTHVGAPIEDLVRDAGNVRGAVHLDDTHQLCFPLQAAPGTGPLSVRPRVATYDYRAGKWSIRTLPMLAQSSRASRLNEVMHATAWRGRQGNTSLAVLAQSGLALQRSRSDAVYADVNFAGASESVCLDVVTEWFHPAGIVGQWLCDEIGIQTERVHPGPLTIQAWYNVDGVFAGTYNESVPHCSFTYAGTSAPAYIPFRLDVLRVSWVKLRIFEPTTAPATENVRLVSLSLRWRALPGPRRVARV